MATEVQLCPQEGCHLARTTTTDAEGYYQFAFHSLLEVVTNTEQSTGHCTPGEIHVKPRGGASKSIFSVYYSGEDYENEKDKHQLAHIYGTRASWGWTDQQPDLHQFFVLHPPQDSALPEAINSALTPLLLVHGHAGKDSTWLGLKPLLEALGHQTWEVYYPGRDRLEEGAAALRDAVESVLRHYSVKQVDIVTHSMGGPVSRAYVSGSARYPCDGSVAPVSYTPHVRKLIQLAPPNAGVLNITRMGKPFWSGYCAIALEALQLLGAYDVSEPAVQDLAFASPFMSQLYNRAIPLAAKDMLIVAGTKSPLRLCQEAKNQTDLYVGSSSASLLERGVALGLVYRDHSEMVAQVDVLQRPLQGAAPQPPFDDDADPYNDAAQLLALIDGFLQGDLVKVKQNLDVYIDPGDTPMRPQTWEVTVTDRRTSPPSLATRTNWPADQWNDRHYDTDFDAGGFLLRLPEQADRPEGQPRICDAVHNRCWPLTQAAASGLWFLDDTDLGFTLPTSAFGCEYIISLEENGTEHQLGRFEVRPLQVRHITLSSVYLPSVQKTGRGALQTHTDGKPTREQRYRPISSRVSPY